MASVVEQLIGLTPVASHGLQADRDSESAVNKDPNHHLELPEFSHPYPRVACHPLTMQYTREVDEWLLSHGVDEELGKDVWSVFVKQDTPGLGGYMYAELGFEPNELLWTMKFLGWLFALDSFLDETESAVDVDRACQTALDVTLVIAWQYPDDQRFLDYVKHLSDAISSDHSISAVKQFQFNLYCAKDETKTIHQVKLHPLGAAMRELWDSYRENVPLGIAKRFAYYVLDFLTGAIEETRIRTGQRDLTMAEFILLRRLQSAVRTGIVLTDLITARRIKERKSESGQVCYIPDYFFWAGGIQSLLDAATDIMAWDNDMLSYHKDCTAANNIHNMVYLAQERSSNHEGAEMVCQIMLERIHEMERIYFEVRAMASPEVRPTIDLYMKACREMTSGSHEWHIRSTRYASGVRLPQT